MELSLNNFYNTPKNLSVSLHSVFKLTVKWIIFIVFNYNNYTLFTNSAGKIKYFLSEILWRIIVNIDYLFTIKRKIFNVILINKTIIIFS